MASSEIFRVNYYVGGLLAQGGNLWIEGSKILFSPTSALDRAMGAKNVEIPFQHIRSVTYTGVLSRAFSIKTDEKTHKFEGSQAKKFWDLMEKSLPNKGLLPPLGTHPKVGTAPLMAPVAQTAAASPVLMPKNMPNLSCDQCAKEVQPGYSFCPHCATRLKSVCSSCHRTVDLHWSACAFCGWKFSAAA